ncbi:MAG: S1C family serine protease [Vampirovibrionia bacterium]
MNSKLFKFQYFLLIFLIGAVFAPVSYSEQPYIYTTDESVNINVYQKVSPCVVTVMADASKGASSGTGVVIDPTGIVLTSSHVIGNAKEISISMASGRRYLAKLLAITGKNDDLALLKISAPYPLPYAHLGDSTKIRVGQKVLAIGNPYGFERTLTTGIISRIDYERHKIQTDAVINPGSSGGPLLNTRGDVIGINQSVYNPEKSHVNIGISFAVPINAAKKFVKEVSSSNSSFSNVLNNDDETQKLINFDEQVSQ